MISGAEAGAVGAVRVACCQIAPVVGEKQANLGKTAEFIERAAKQGANIVVLPELCSSGYVFETRSEARALSDTHRTSSSRSGGTSARDATRTAAPRTPFAPLALTRSSASAAS